MEKMLTNFLKFFEKLFNLFLHVFFMGVVLYFIWPILSLYWNQKPAVGIDLFLSVDFVTYIRDHLNWPWASWKYIWYGGTPLLQTYPLLHFYLMQPFLNWFSAVQAVQIYVLSSICLFFIFLYLIFLGFDKGNKKYIYLAGFLSGLFLLAHPQSFLAFIVPFSAILIAF